MKLSVDWKDLIKINYIMNILNNKNIVPLGLLDDGIYPNKSYKNIIYLYYRNNKHLYMFRTNDCIEIDLTLLSSYDNIILYSITTENLIDNLNFEDFESKNIVSNSAIYEYEYARDKDLFIHILIPCISSIHSIIINDYDSTHLFSLLDVKEYNGLNYYYYRSNTKITLKSESYIRTTIVPKSYEYGGYSYWREGLNEKENFNLNVVRVSKNDIDKIPIIDKQVILEYDTNTIYVDNANSRTIYSIKSISDTDLDDVLQSGVYNCKDNISNIPIEGSCVLFVSNIDGTVYQNININNKIYHRTLNDDKKWNVIDFDALNLNIQDLYSITSSNTDNIQDLYSITSSNTDNIQLLEENKTSVVDFNLLKAVVDTKASQSQVEILLSRLENVGTPIKQYKDRVNNISDLPEEGNKIGDGRVVTEDVNENGQSYIWVWDGESWSRTPYTTLPADVVTNSRFKSIENQVVTTQIYLGIGNINGRYIKNLADKFEMGYSDTFVVSDFMTVFSTSLTISGLSQGGSDAVQWAMFDKDKNYLGVFKPVPNGLLNKNTIYEYSLPNDDCRFIKSSTHVNDIDTFTCVNKGINAFKSTNISMYNLNTIGEFNVYSKLGNKNGYIINSSESLQIGASSNWIYTDFMPVLTPHLKISGVSVPGSEAVQWAMFDNDKNFIDVFKPTLGNSPTETYRHYVTNPVARYIRASLTKADSETFSLVCESSNRIEASIKDIKSIKDFLLNVGMFRNEVQSYDSTRNKNGYYIKNDNDEYTEGSEATFSISGFLPIHSKTIDIKGMTQSGSDGVKWAKFDDKKKFLGVFKPVPNGLLSISTIHSYIEEDPNCAFYKASIHNNNLETFSLVCKNVSVLENVPLTKDVIANETTEDVNPLEYNIPTFVKACRNDWDDFNAKTIQLQGYYDAFDHLADAFRKYVTRNEPIGESTLPTGRFFDIDPNVYPINHYTFARVGLAADAPKLIICAGIHGDSEGEGWLNNGGDKIQSMVCSYYFLKDLCWNYESNPILKYLHENVRIEVIPIMNPWGVQNHSRWNGRNVDLNRNYDNNWDDPRAVGKGEAPFSENESQAFRDFINNNLDAKLCIDIHTRGGDIINNDLRWWGSAYSDIQTKVFDDVIAVMMSKYGGTGTKSYDVGTPEKSLPTSSGWINYKAGVPSILPELFGSVNMNIATINSEDVNRQSLHYLALLIQRGLRAYNVI